ncbi:hypothetical protein AMTRI_Chr13g125240 [Amborella trichopoda]|uniref:mitochondrial import receptor subunit TOM6 homolog n=1 Tax=Amborella trichopoda TaxID=13333 RepID=UPI0005D36635|nr:mitochondrial import receptor subunit TOM6 homolog [Amborella trichopoda]|eukprot:XP_011627727.1 mitochondrial import receptor subunit TOM6 homolog [Amborella trichopoda]
MFLGAIPRRPDKETAYKQLKSHVTLFGAFVLAVRVVPYVLHFINKEKEELKLDL